jgi:hypothetical protein
MDNSNNELKTAKNIVPKGEARKATTKATPNTVVSNWDTLLLLFPLPPGGKKEDNIVREERFCREWSEPVNDRAVVRLWNSNAVQGC